MKETGLIYMGEVRTDPDLFANLTPKKYYASKPIKIGSYYDRKIVNDVGREVLVTSTFLKNTKIFKIVYEK